MILVITGTERFSFHRLVERVDRVALRSDFTTDVFMQIGTSRYEPTSSQWRRMISFSEMVQRIEQARLVISHAGAGSTLLCLRMGQRPIVMPRRRRFGEHVDDHQVHFAQRLHEQGLVRAVIDGGRLEAAMREELSRPAPPRHDPAGRELVSHLEGLLDDWEQQGDRGALRLTHPSRNRSAGQSVTT